MVALETSCDLRAVRRIDAALAAKEAGDSVEFNRIILALSPEKDPTETANILTGLTHFSTSLNDPTITPCRYESLHEIFDAAINLNFARCLPLSAQFRRDEAGHPKCVDGIIKNSVNLTATKYSHSTVSTTALQNVSLENEEHVDKSPSPPVPRQLLESYKDFVENTASADSAFVDQLLVSFIRFHFKLPLPQFNSLLDCVHQVLSTILGTYPSAESMFVRLVCEHYPHPVRPQDEHKYFAKALLTVVARTESPSLASALISIVLEKVATIDAMVPDPVGDFADSDSAGNSSESVSCSGRCAGRDCDCSRRSSLGDTESARFSPIMSSDEDSSCSKGCSKKVFILDPVAEKMDTLLHEILSMLQTILSSKPRPPISATVFDAVLQGFESFILTSESGLHASFILLFATSVSGSQAVTSTAERYRVSFFEPDLSHRVRIAYLYHSAALICRSKCVSARQVRIWLDKVSWWLNSYIDRHNDGHCTADVKKHELFYAAVFAMMYTLCARCDVFDSLEGGSLEAAHELRVFRIMSTDFNPSHVLPPALVTRLCSVLISQGNMDLSDVLQPSEGERGPARIRYSNLNRLSPVMPMENCGLPASRALVWTYYRPHRRYGSSHSRKRSRSPVSCVKNVAQEGYSENVDATFQNMKRRRVI